MFDLNVSITVTV